MLAFIIRRFLLAFLTMWVISILSFVIIQLPPGDFVTTYIAQLSASGSSVTAAEADSCASSTASTARSMSNTRNG